MNARSLFTVLLLCFAMAGIGQNNFTGFNYQAVVRNATGDPLPNQAIGVRVQMYPTGSNGYTERHTVTTDANGQIKLVMGEGTPEAGSTVPTFAGLDWTSSEVMNYAVSVDITGGTTYTALGSGQFKSVPFALRSLTSGGGSAVGWALSGNDQSNTNSGNVGIGTPTPTQKLDVVSSGDAFVRTSTTSGTSQSGLIMSKANAGDWSLYPQPVNGVGNLMLDYAGSTKLFVEGNSGNVGIGTTAPEANLDVVGGQYGLQVRGGDVKIATYTGTGCGGPNGGWFGTRTNHPLYFFTNNGCESMIITPDNKVGIGTSTPANTLDVEGGAAIGAAYSGTNTAPANGLLVQGNVGIGTPSPSANLEVAGTFKLVDGNQGPNKVLTSDINGLATWVTPATSAGVGWALTGNNLANTNSGNVGIGTSTPAAKLDVIGRARINGVTVGRGFGTNDSTSTVLGVRSLAAGSTSPRGNTAIGYEALATGGAFLNTAVGYKALRSVTIGQGENCAFGKESLTNNTGGVLNAAFGSDAMRLNTNGNFNTAFGGSSLKNNTTGSENVALGFGTLENSTGEFNTACGARSMYTNTTGTMNSVVGYAANVASGVLTNATAIGARALVAQSNTLVLGSINGVNGATDDVNVGIGTNSPANRLTVQTANGYGIVHTNGTTKVGTYVDDDYGWLGTNSPHPLAFYTDGSAPGMLLSTDGNLGIGSMAPQSRLAVNGGAAIGSTYSGTNAAPANGLLVEGNVGIGTPSLLSKLAVNGGVAVGSAYSGAAAAPVNGAIIQGSVGIGTPTMHQATKLAVQGGMVIGGAFTNNNYAAPEWGAIIEGNVGIGTTAPGDKLSIRNGAMSLHAPAHDVPYVGLDYDPATDGMRFRANLSATALNTTHMTILRASGNVGIGTPNPQSKLAVNGKITCREVEVTLAGFPDYVFEKDYRLMPLVEVEKYITANGHLPNVPSACEVEENGIGLGQLNRILLEKVEELTLHLIEKERMLNELQQRLGKVEDELGAH